MESKTSLKDQENIYKIFYILIGSPYQNDIVQFFIINQRVKGKVLNLVFIHKVYLLELVTIVNIKGQVFSQASRSRQPTPMVIVLTMYSTDKWNPIDMVMLMKHTMTERMTIDKFHEVFVTQAIQQENNDVIKIVQLVQLEQ